MCLLPRTTVRYGPHFNSNATLLSTPRHDTGRISSHFLHMELQCDWPRRGFQYARALTAHLRGRSLCSSRHRPRARCYRYTARTRGSTTGISAARWWVHFPHPVQPASGCAITIILFAEFRDMAPGKGCLIAPPGPAARSNARRFSIRI